MTASEDSSDRQSPRECRAISRRAAIGLGLGLVVAPSLAAAQEEAGRLRPQPGDLLIGVGGDDHKPLTPDDVPLRDKQTFAWPIDPASETVRNGSRLNKVLLLRLDPTGFDDATRERAAAGVVAYSAVCPHTGCDVTGWDADGQRLGCPCHFSQFDPKEAARVIGGPAPRPLPALPLKIVDRRLVVAKPFTARAGFLQM